MDPSKPEESSKAGELYISMQLGVLQCILRAIERVTKPERHEGIWLWLDIIRLALIRCRMVSHLYDTPDVDHTRSTCYARGCAKATKMQHTFCSDHARIMSAMRAGYLAPDAAYAEMTSTFGVVSPEGPNQMRKRILRELNMLIRALDARCTFIESLSGRYPSTTERAGGWSYMKPLIDRATAMILTLSYQPTRRRNHTDMPTYNVVAQVTG